MRIQMKTKCHVTSPTTSVYRTSKRVVGKHGNPLLVSNYVTMVVNADGYCDFVPIARVSIPYDKNASAHLVRLDGLYLKGGAA